MKKILSLALVFSLIFTFALSPQASAEGAEKTLPSGLANGDLPTAIEGYVSDHEKTTCGLNVLVYDRDGTIYENAFGYADKEKKLATNEDTVYEWGSVSKLMVWVSVMQLVEEGKIDLNADIQTYLPEGFLTNLRYDKPMTMVDLMNHQAGFQDTYFIQTADPSELTSLEATLRTRQPKQVYAPGEHTAYSNWGAALAAYIVQRVSGMDYVSYVHEHIFKPLHMEHTSISPNYGDNEWVHDRRMKLKCYDTEGEAIGGAGLYYILLYPAGSAAGTIEDLGKFARALTPDEAHPSPLFKKQATLREMESPTAFYGSTDVEKNLHGFFASYYGVETLGHGGNTFGCSSMLQFDPVSGVGMVLMTNQAHETVFNYDMYELIYGKFADSPLARVKREVPKGLLLNTRGIIEGPLSFLGAMGVITYSEEDLDNWWYEEDKTVETPFSDFTLSTVQAIANLTCMVLFILAGLCGFVKIVGGLIVDSLIKKKRHVSADSLRKHAYVLSGWMALALANLVILFARLSTGYSTGNIGRPESYMIQSALFGVLVILMALTLFLARKNACGNVTKKERRKFLITVLLAMVQCMVIVTFEMYKFWAI
ncbi:serine hydrolase domain-containing protein [Aedoeadaptatus coli]|uniref:serine hydrolase domain-containing protein n=1 Tax=Aedoeadaptatus coli TaxID=2058292 RepID=UPI000D54EAC9|nr:serine hydrolase domain-containing protein [Peptoniphilus coli]